MLPLQVNPHALLHISAVYSGMIVVLLTDSRFHQNSIPAKRNRANDISLYVVSNYYILIAQIIQQMALCDSYEQGEIYLQLCKTAVNLNFSFDSLRLSNNYADLVI